MTRRLLLSIATGLFVLFASAQNAPRSGYVSEGIDAKRASGVRFNTVSLFSNAPRSAQTDALWERALTKANVLRMDHGATVSFLTSRPAFISMELPTDEGTITVDLERTDITTDDFSVVVASTGSATNYLPGAHYQGMIRGVPGSLAAISVFEDEVMGIISDANGDRILGRLEGDTEGNHVFYRESDLRATSGAVCGTSDEDHFSKEPDGQGSTKTVKCVRFYWEVNYDIFQGKGSVLDATNYVTGLFNQSAILYANDGISVLLSQVFVWDVVSPYTQTSTSALLDQFGVTRTSFNGDLAHLLGYAGGGGIAWLNTLCNSQTRLRMAYSDVNSTFNNVPTYSWSVEVVTHEQGHSMGSKHTHACAWNGNNTAIDGCGPTANSAYAEGSCAIGPIPSSSVGGTIMSYCHLISAGINFANGFGPQPTTVIVNSINNASCLTNCSVSCGNPSALAAGSITNTSAGLSWGAVAGATSYSLQWKQSSGSTWTSVTGIATNSYTLNGLTAGTSYQYQVLAVCPSGSSIYSSVFTFATTGGCVDTLEPNNSTAAPAIVTLPVATNALIASASDADYYRFTLAATSNVNITLGSLPFDYDLRLLNSAGTQVAISESGGTTSESISYPNAAAGNYYIHVFGYNGAFSLTQCYALNASATPVQTCGVPTNLAAGSITTTSASLSWAAVSGAVSYTLQWKLNSGSTWTTIPGIANTSYSLTGLSAGTAYNFQVLTVCNGGSSAYASPVTFTTSAPPCNVPSGLSAGSITTSSASLSWGAVSGAVTYTLQWKLASAGTWTTVTGIATNAYALSGLAANTAYNFQVLTVCTGGSSGYSSPATFTTAAATCSDPYEANNTMATSTQMTANVTLNALIGSGTDQDWFRFSNSTAQKNIKVTLTGLPANYNLRLYRASTQVGNSANTGTTNEQIILNNASVSSVYRVRVIGASATQFSTTQCYTLTIQISSTPFSMPEGMVEGGVEEGGEAMDAGIALFPNPASDLVNVSVPSSDGTTYVELLDGMGRIVGTMTRGSADAPTMMVLDVSGKPSGLYLVRVTQGEESTIQRLVVGR